MLLERSLVEIQNYPRHRPACHNGCNGTKFQTRARCCRNNGLSVLAEIADTRAMNDESLSRDYRVWHNNVSKRVEAAAMPICKIVFFAAGRRSPVGCGIVGVVRVLGHAFELREQGVQLRPILVVLGKFPVFLCENVLCTKLVFQNPLS